MDLATTDTTPVDPPASPYALPYTTIYLHIWLTTILVSTSISPPHQPDPAHPHLSVVPLPSPRTIQIQHTRAVRQGASWTAAYHLQLTVAAGPDPSVAAWVPSASLLLSGPGGCSPGRRLPGGASSRYRGVGRRRRGRHCQQARHGVGRRCPPMRCPPIRVLASGIRLSSRPVSGHLGSSSRGSSGRPSAVHPSSVQPPAVHPSGVCPSGVQPSGVCPRPSGRVRLLPLRRWRWGPGRGGRATLTTGRVEAPVAAGPSTARSTVAEAGTRATLPTSRWSVGGGWRTRAAGLGGGGGGRACPLSDQAGQAGVRSARRGRLRGGHGCRR